MVIEFEFIAESPDESARIVVSEPENQSAACELARISVSTAYRWIAEGRIQAYGHRGCLRVRMRELLSGLGP